MLSFTSACGPVLLWSPSMFSGDSFHLLLLTPLDNVYSFGPNVEYCLSPTFDSSESLLEITLLTMSECRFLAHALCTLRSDFTPKTLLYVLGEAFLCCTAGMRRLPVWFWLIWMSSLYVLTLTVWVFSLAILIFFPHSTSMPDWSLFFFFFFLHFHQCISCDGEPVLGAVAPWSRNKYQLEEDRWKPYPQLSCT